MAIDIIDVNADSFEDVFNIINGNANEIPNAWTYGDSQLQIDRFGGGSDTIIIPAPPNQVLSGLLPLSLAATSFQVAGGLVVVIGEYKVVPSTTVTIANAHATLYRIDTIRYNLTTDLVEIMTGTPDVFPIAPVLDGPDQVLLYHIQVGPVSLSLDPAIIMARVWDPLEPFTTQAGFKVVSTLLVRADATLGLQHSNVFVHPVSSAITIYLPSIIAPTNPSSSWYSGGEIQDSVVIEIGVHHTAATYNVTIIDNQYGIDGGTQIVIDRRASIRLVKIQNEWQSNWTP